MRADLRLAIVVALAMAMASALASAITPRLYMADKYKREKLAEIVPLAFGEWQVDRAVIPVQPSPDVQQVLDETYDETLARTYRNPQGKRIMLSLAYGRNQHKGMNTHRPEICYPAQGFRLVTSGLRDHIAFEGKDIPVTRVVAAEGARNEPITYWLLVGERITFFGREQRLTTIRYGLQLVIPDGVLVRVSSIDDDNAAAFRLHDQFIADMLRSAVPSRLPRLLGSM